MGLKLVQVQLVEVYHGESGGRKSSPLSISSTTDYTVADWKVVEIVGSKREWTVDQKIGMYRKSSPYFYHLAHGPAELQHSISTASCAAESIS